MNLPVRRPPSCSLIQCFVQTPSHPRKYSATWPLLSKSLTFSSYSNCAMSSQIPSPKRRKIDDTTTGLSSQNMVETIELTPVEATLRTLLLDVVSFISLGRDGDMGTANKGSTEPLELRFTGGWVRDKLLGVNSQDIDVGISTMTGYRFGLAMQKYLHEAGNVEKYKKMHPNDKAFEKGFGLHKIEANPEKSKHLETVTTKIFGLDVDLVNLRKETYTEESRNPQMEFGTPEEDALRRDATVNALFYNLHTERVEDLTGRGLDDMKKHMIRTPLAPYQTFKDDPLRVLRLIRFATRLCYTIDPHTEQFMGDEEIKHALNTKITRERVGKEIEKMLKGPDPCRSLEFIDRLGLFKTVFSGPEMPQLEPSNRLCWSDAYSGLHDLLLSDEPKIGDQSLSSMLVRTDEDLYHGWNLAAFIPWAHIGNVAPEGILIKKGVELVVVIAQESIKAENKISRVLGGSVKNLSSIVELRDYVYDLPPSELEQKPFNHDIRGRLGMAVRQWGSQWRLQVLFAILVDFASKPEGHIVSPPEYGKWVKFMSCLKELHLLDADSMPPIANGNEVVSALGNPKKGPWLGKAIEDMTEWQFKNPAGTKEAALEVIVCRREEFGV